MKAGKFDIKFGSQTIPAIYITDAASALTILVQLINKFEDGGNTYAIDTETMALPKYKNIPDAALNPYYSKVRLIQVYDNHPIPTVYIFDVLKIDSDPLFGEFLERCWFVGHNSIFDLQYFYKQFGISRMTIGCSCIAARLVSCASTHVHVKHGLKDLTDALLGENILKEMQLSDWSVPELTFEQLEYAGLDAICTYKVAEKLTASIQKLGLTKIYNLYKMAQHPIVKMQLAGMRLDVERYRQLIDNWRVEVGESRRELVKLTKMQVINSHSIASYLEMNLDPDTLALWPRSETGKLQTDAHAFADFDYLPIVKPFSKFQKASKLCTAFGKVLIDSINKETGRLHCRYTLGGTRTGRLSCSEPNLQQMPRDKRVRECFVPESGCQIVCADFSQIELRVAAELSRDAAMLRAYRDGIDLHALTAANIMGKAVDAVTDDERQMAKACFSGDTELLTPTGWLRLDKYQVGTPVAQYETPCGVDINYTGNRASGRFTKSMKRSNFNGLGGKITFVTPLDYRMYTDQKVLEYEDGRLSLKATPNHEVLYVTAAGDVRKTAFEDVLTKTVRHTVSAGFLDKPPPSVADDFVRLMAAIIADGSFKLNTDGSCSTIRFGFVKPRKIKRLRELCMRLNIFVEQQTYLDRKTSTGKVTCMNISSPRIIKEVLAYVSPDKSLSWKALYDFDNYVYLEEAQFWDGHLITKGAADGLVMFSTTNKQTADVMQAMAATSGIVSSLKVRAPRKANHSPLYNFSYPLSVTPLHRPHFDNPLSIKEDKCDVYCVQVPSSNLLIRRNGRVSVMGNCNFGLLFGLGAKKFSHYAKKSYGVDISDQEATRAVKIFRQTYSGYRKWQLDRSDAGAQNLYSTTVLGKLRKLEPDNTFGTSQNTPIQGSAAECMLAALVLLNQSLDPDTENLIACVHDEILVETCGDPEVTQKKIEDAMLYGFLHVFPKGITRGLVAAHAGDSWAAAKKK